MEFSLQKYIFVIALLLVLVMCWHTISFSHDHPEKTFGSGLEAVLHIDDRRWAILMLIMFFIVTGEILKLSSNKFTHSFIEQSFESLKSIEKNTSYKIYNFINFILKKGIIHSKICD